MTEPPTVTVELDRDVVAAVAASFPAAGPVHMLNLLQFHPTARYPDGSDADLPGERVYLERYVTAFNDVAAELGETGIEPVLFGAVHGTLVGPGTERWDAVAIVRYPSFAAFRRIVEHPHYAQRADPHRRAALADWRLVASSVVDTTRSRFAEPMRAGSPASVGRG